MEPTKKTKYDEDDKDYTLVRENPLMKQYYQEVLGLSVSDFDEFWHYMQQPLPVTFRINPNQQNYQKLIEKLRDPQFIPEIVLEGQRLEAKEVPWFPGSLAWQINSNRQEFKKLEPVKQVHSWIQKANDSGLLTRQELVSMVPPLVLQLSKGMDVLDMCAAPGSKTAQMIEMIEGEGLVVANDVDTNRAYMLIHQLQRANTSCMAVINHQAQNFPGIGHRYDRFQFDRVLCDVPCSGDGAIRKIPKKWKNWKLRDGLGVHNLQVCILKRAVSLCKVGGYICYSTCSINPIEDEAVVSEVVNQFSNTIQIANLPEVLETTCPGLVYRKGLKSWKVMGNAKDKSESAFLEYGSYEEVPENFKNVKPSMFPVDVPEDIVNTIRILPHDQNTGGFYIALLYKHGPSMTKPATDPATEPATESVGQAATETPTEPQEELKEPKHKKTRSDQTEYTVLPEDSPEYMNIKDYYGLESLPRELLYCPSTKHRRNIFLISPNVKRLIDHDSRKSLKILNLGVKVFTRHKSKQGTEGCLYRPSQDGIRFISPYCSKRKATCRNPKLLSKLVNEKFAHITDIEDPECEEHLKGTGYFILKFSHEDLQEEISILKLSEDKLLSMIPQEHVASLRIRYNV